MIPQPLVLGLTLCEKIIVDKRSNNVSLIDCLTNLHADSFPTPPHRLCLFAVLTGGHGQGTMQLTVTHLESDTIIASARWEIRFTDRLARHRFIARLKPISFNDPGSYQFAILLDGEWLTETALKVLQQEKQT